jgi:nucleoside-diphosphate-sugar epimerase
MRICILGARGFIGQNVKRAFPDAVALGHEDFDLLDSQKVKQYFSRNEFDVIIHCAVVGGSRLKKDDWSVLDQNLRMFFNVMDATHCKVYYFSSGAALRNFPYPPDDPYGYSKFIIEKYTPQRLQILRIWNCFGIDELPTRFLSTIKSQGHVTIPVDQEFDFFHIDDIVAVLKHIIHQPTYGYPLNMVYPGRKYLLSEIAQMCGSSVTIHGKNESGYTGDYNLFMITLPSFKTRIKEYLAA